MHWPTACSGTTLADELDISRSAVWKHVEALRDEGFEIRSDDAGYALDSVPEFGASAVEYGLDAVFFETSTAFPHERRAGPAEGESTDKQATNRPAVVGA